jgi:hypothetical protein
MFYLCEGILKLAVLWDGGSRLYGLGTINVTNVEIGMGLGGPFGSLWSVQQINTIISFPHFLYCHFRSSL